MIKVSIKHQIKPSLMIGLFSDHSDNKANRIKGR